MGFNTENRTISELFQRQARYVVPRYQREYVWKKRNWNELLTDITFTLNYKNEASKNEWTHFLGTIVLSSNVSLKSSEEIKGIKDYEIIDGQQRITTIFILTVSLCSTLFKLNNPEAFKRAEYLESSFINSRTSRNELIPVLYNSDYVDDIKSLLQIMREEGYYTLDEGNKYKDAFEYFNDYFSNMSFVQLDTFIEKLFDINIVEIVSEQEEEIYNIFEVLNARGQQLKQIELLKNHIMKYIFPRENDYIDSARKKWNDIYANTDDLTDRDDMLNHFAKCYLKKKAENSDEVYKLLKEEIQIEKMQAFLTDLHSFSKIYVNATDKSTDNRSIEYFNIKNNKQISTLISSIFHLKDKEIISSDIMDKALLNLRNFFFIFNASQHTSNRTDNIIKNAAYNIYHCEYETHFKFEMTNLFIELLPLVNFQTFKNTYYLTLKYSNRNRRLNNGKLIKYILVELFSQFQNDSKLDGSNLTIEHLLGDNGDTENAQLQNLTITSEEINNEKLKDKPIAEKINILIKESSLVLNKSLHVYLNKQQEFDSDQRKKDLAEILYNKVFNFNTEIFNITPLDVKVFQEYSKKLRDVEQKLTGIEKEKISELINLLQLSGKNFKQRVENDPSCNELKPLYQKYCIQSSEYKVKQLQINI